MMANRLDRGEENPIGKMNDCVRFADEDLASEFH